MDAVQVIEARRKAITSELLAIRSMLKGTVSEQFFPVVRDGKKTGEMRGPYAVHTCKVAGKTVSKRLKGAAGERARQDAANYRRFRSLCHEFEELTQHLGELEREGGASEEALKRGLKPPSNRMRR